MDAAAADPNSIFVLVLGPVTIAALVALFVWWMTHRPDDNDHDQRH